MQFEKQEDEGGAVRSKEKRRSRRVAAKDATPNRKQARQANADDAVNAVPGNQEEAQRAVPTSGPASLLWLVPPVAAASTKVNAPFDAEVARLAQLDRLDYEQQRKHVARSHSVRVSYLDEAVEGWRMEHAEYATGRAGAQPIDEDYFPEPVNGAELLNQIEAEIEHHVLLPPGASPAIATWILGTYIQCAFDIYAYLVISSPVMRCGKTTVMRLLNLLANNPLFCSNITSAALFRAISENEPTLLIDEADTFLAKTQDLKGIINSGHSRDAAYVVRVDPTTGRPVKFSTWGPKVIAMIGAPAETIVDRSIVIPMRRKLPSESAQALDQENPAFVDIRRKCLRWAMDNVGRTDTVTGHRIERLNDRAQDNWRPLLAIADLAGSAWPEKVREAAHRLDGHMLTADEQYEILLLDDIRTVFQETQATRLPTVTLLEQLTAMADSPWKTWKGRGKIEGQGLAGLLRKFGIRRRQIREGDVNFKGYYRDAFEDAFARYLPETR